MKILKWTVAGAGSYFGTIWIKSFWYNLIVSTILWFLILYLLDRFLEE